MAEEVGATVEAMDGAVAALNAARDAMDELAKVFSTAMASAASATGAGLAGLDSQLDVLGEDAKKIAEERSNECDALARGITKTVDALREADSRGQADLRAVSFGGVTG